MDQLGGIHGKDDVEGHRQGLVKIQILKRQVGKEGDQELVRDGVVADLVVEGRQPAQ
ncbi:hypothetical protein predicted by Glimmer/Critica [Limosilactobacillus fermentum]|nr:hypothetical protein predicted by Glimmer/Critica [Limosilactobacillus fermentum]